MDFNTIIYEKNDRVAIITLNRPEKKNAINLEMKREIAKALDEIEEDPEVKAVLITGNPECFCAGGDLAQGEEDRLAGRVENIWQRIHELEKPTVAAISGWCIAGGLELALRCDLRVASETARIGDRHIRIGVVGGAGITALLPRVVGAARAKELHFTGEDIDGQEAYRIGLVNRVYPVERYLEESLELARKIAAMSSFTLKMTKKAVDMGLNLNLRESLYYSEDCAKATRQSPAFEEGVKAFAEKRQPKFD